jgi:hypothetical protein
MLPVFLKRRKARCVHVHPKRVEEVVSTAEYAVCKARTLKSAQSPCPVALHTPAWILRRNVVTHMSWAVKGVAPRRVKGRRTRPYTYRCSVGRRAARIITRCNIGWSMCDTVVLENNVPLFLMISKCQNRGKRRFRRPLRIGYWVNRPSSWPMCMRKGRRKGRFSRSERKVGHCWIMLSAVTSNLRLVKMHFAKTLRSKESA